MKQFYTLFLLFALNVTFGQAKQYDYFVQFNGNQLSKKVNIADVLNHPLIAKYKDGKASLDLNKYAALFQLDQKTTIHGNFTDSIPYYQVTIPIKNKEAIKKFLIEHHSINQNTDLVEVPTIQDYAKYSVCTPKNQKTSFAWNDNYLVIVEFTKRYYSNRYNWENEMVDSVAVEEPYQETAIGTVEETAANDDTEEEEEEYTGMSNAEYEKAEADFNFAQAEKQSLFIKALFENGFVMPTSEKINETADISSWLNYSSAMSSLNSAYGAISQFTSYNKLLPLQKNIGNFVKGVNLDFYFDNDNARIEEIVEYDEAMARIVEKMTDRKINKNIYNYFPDEQPLVYASYHINSKATLQHFPSLMTELFQSPQLAKEDISIITDLISTIVDEEATATLFDGDLSMFLYNMKNIEVKTKSYGYGENYEETVTEQKTEKTIPLFTMVFTSTHPTFGDKLIQLGVRKKLLIQKGDMYFIYGTEEYGNVFLKKDKDVVVVGNTMDHFNTGKGTFSKEAKKDLKKNFISGKMNISLFSNVYGNSGKAKEGELKKFDRVSAQFKDVTFQSSKKLIENKLKFELKLNSLKSDKNIILQTLDLTEELMSK
jgi:bifunctional DNA-binding transcriptional regulator/antitoxin component of YhaV-PrlF toxin-antitoxin module